MFGIRPRGCRRGHASRLPCERRCADRSAEIEGEDLVVPITTELHRHQRQQHGLAGAGRPHDQRVADIADVERETNGVEPSVLPKKSGGALKCSSRAGPAQTAESGIMCARFNVETGG